MLLKAAQGLCDQCIEVECNQPVVCTYHPLEYAWDGHRRYVERFGQAPREVLVVGMNPGPWGMGQTGVPFGDPTMVRDEMGIEEIDVHRPRNAIEDRPVYGLESPRSEVSGTRLYSGLIDAYGSLDEAYERLFVANYCPVLFYGEGASNITPPKLRKADRQKLFEACDEHLHQLLDYFEPERVIGVGRFAERRAQAVIDQRGEDTPVEYLLHPSPANPHANRDGGRYWEEKLQETLQEAGIEP